MSIHSGGNSFLIIMIITLFLGCGEGDKSESKETKMISLHDVPSVTYDIRYATENNFTGEKIYPMPGVFLVEPAARALLEVVHDLNQRGLSIRIFDAYRPLSAQRKLWEINPDPTFVADPAKGSRHNRGAAIDLSLTDLQGELLPMPTDYDEFVDAAAHDYEDLPDSVIKNRELLRSVMEKHGFVALNSEWWHYDYQGWEEFPVLDKDFEELIKNHSK